MQVWDRRDSRHIGSVGLDLEHPLSDIMKGALQSPLDHQIIGGRDLCDQRLLLNLPRWVLDSCRRSTVPLQSGMVHEVDWILLICQGAHSIEPGPDHGARDGPRNLTLLRRNRGRPVEIG